jgi:hypothetical protein
MGTVCSQAADCAGHGAAVLARPAAAAAAARTSHVSKLRGLQQALSPSQLHRMSRMCRLVPCCVELSEQLHQQNPMAQLYNTFM